MMLHCLIFQYKLFTVIVRPILFFFQVDTFTLTISGRILIFTDQINWSDIIFQTTKG